MGRASTWGAPATIALISAVTALAATSCDGDDETSTVVAVPTSTSACTRYAQVGCALNAQCVPSILQRTFGSEAECARRTEQVCESVFGIEGSLLTPDGLLACANAFELAGCETIFTGELPPACDVFKGTHAAGSSCSSDIQCQSGACDATGNEPCGACAALAGPGVPCGGNQYCDHGLHCASGVCAVDVAAGGACDAATGPACKPQLVCTGGTCGARLQAGDSCDPADSGCDAFADLVCSESDHRCVAVTSAGAGQACGSVASAGSWVFCAAGTYCERESASSDTGVCKPRVPDGGSCAAGSGTVANAGPCEPSAKCVDEVCTLQALSCP